METEITREENVTMKLSNTEQIVDLEKCYIIEKNKVNEFEKEIKSSFWDIYTFVYGMMTGTGCSYNVLEQTRLNLEEFIRGKVENLEDHIEHMLDMD